MKRQNSQLLDAAGCEDAYCLDESHKHKNRVEEAVCSFRYQLAQERAKNKGLEARIGHLRLHVQALGKALDAECDPRSSQAWEAPAAVVCECCTIAEAAAQPEGEQP